MCCQTNKVIRSMYTDALAAYVTVPYQAFTTVLCSYGAGVLKRRCGKTWTRPSSPLASQTVGLHGQSLRVTLREQVRSYVIPEVSPRSSSLKLIFKGIGMENTHYIRLEEGLYLTSYSTIAESFVRKKRLSVVYHKYITSGELTLLMKFRVGVR